MRCPLCNRMHRYQHTAKRCFQEVIISESIVAEKSVTKKQAEMKGRVKCYYFDLPKHPKHLED